jgi:hypothetical protein
VELVYEFHTLARFKTTRLLSRGLPGEVRGRLVGEIAIRAARGQPVQLAFVRYRHPFRFYLRGSV